MNDEQFSSTASRRDTPVLPLPGISYPPAPPLSSHYLLRIPTHSDGSEDAADS